MTHPTLERSLPFRARIMYDYWMQILEKTCWDTVVRLLGYSTAKMSVDTSTYRRICGKSDSPAFAMPHKDLLGQVTYFWPLMSDETEGQSDHIVPFLLHLLFQTRFLLQRGDPIRWDLVQNTDTVIWTELGTFDNFLWQAPDLAKCEWKRSASELL